MSGDQYLDAINCIHQFGREMAPFFERYDMLLTATLAEPPASVGRFAHTNPDFLDYRMGKGGIFAYSPFTAPFNASGQPAASVPLHWNAEGLPIGVQLAAGFGEDELLISLCAELEAARPWFHRRPALVTAL
jgi:amidase/6-aminohexanoate-cyclic-dimer hydrolase